jgi:hypothetical protein
MKKIRPWDLESWFGPVFLLAVAFGIVCTVAYAWLVSHG